ncbi:hypothetical protein PFFVO_01786 [Plasmodium falciparum Vietnam Oak-Knoll (FVO)]|uniref:Uncharacterized protein n=1 Tax=Plasmodium falciparum Vietnam Oak-Knoll (FVO) TaxID=1036723 RepID=A0A024V9J0_PLAFA|nr:hypothetical protein PFFVO_01786 [Plasmodium falciparum Vietnam Oak-Knoll (FVO)]
MQFYQPRMNY